MTTTHIVCPHCNATNRIPSARLAEQPMCGRCKAPLFQGHPVALDRAGFESQLAHSDTPLLVDFWAPWCGPCRMMAPVFDQVARQLEPSVRVIKINTDEQRALAERYNIRSIPTIALFRHGQEIARQAGAMDAGTLLRWVNGYL